MHGRDVFGLVGRSIAGKLRFERVLGEGGYGVVYAGTHLAIGMPVAIKCLKPVGFTPEEHARSAESFLREARILFGLGHPNIVRLYDVGVIEGGQIPYAVLELLSGTTLDLEIAERRRAQRPFDANDLLATFLPILEGVAFAHERGIVHRDLKPSNLMLVDEGGGVRRVPKVLDFGTARGERAGTGKVADASGRTGFTPLYAAPEQWDAASGVTGPHTDVFALGLTIAEACLLTYPLGSPDGVLGVFRAVVDEAARPSLALHRPDLPPDLERVVLRALRVRPHERYVDARELLASFRTALRAETSTTPLARPSHPQPQPQPQGVPNPPAPSYPPNPPAPPRPLAIVGTPTFGASTTQPHAFVGSQRAEAPRASALPWVIGAVGLAVALVAIGIGLAVAVAASMRTDREPASAAPPPRVVSPAAPGVATETPGVPTTTTPSSAAKAAPGSKPPATPAAPASQAPAVNGRVPRLLLVNALDPKPFWTVAEVLAVAKSHDAAVQACARDAFAMMPSINGDVSVTVSPEKDGTIGSVMCGMRARSTGETVLCACLQGEMATWRLPPAHGKLGMLDAGPFIYEYRLVTPP